MGRSANILDAYSRENDRALLRTARLIPGAQRRFAQTVLEAGQKGCGARPTSMRRTRPPRIILPAILREFSPDALGTAICDAGVVAVVFVVERLALQVYLPLSTFFLFLFSFILFATSEGLYAGTPVSLGRSFLSLAKSAAATALLICLGQAPWASPFLFLRIVLLSAYSLCGLFAVWQLRYAFECLPAALSRNVLIVGQGAHARRLAHAVQSDASRKAVLRGTISDSQLKSHGLGILTAAARGEYVDEVVVATEDAELRAAVVCEAMRNRLDICLAPELGAVIGNPMQVTYLQNFPALKMAQGQPCWGLAVKRVSDAAISACALIALFPLLALMAALIWLDSRGPVLYRSTRIGRKGSPFTCYKFRTMVIGAEQLQSQLRAINQRQGAFFKIARDPRITRIGGFLRRYSLDEFPQLWNVLRGEMSLVGPRPHPAADVRLYRLEHLQRLDFVPGMTGLWQVTARNDPSFENSVELDRQYISQWNLWLDLKILLKTCRVVLQGSGM